MMCLKVLLALLQSDIHLRDVGTETGTASERVHPRVWVCVGFFVSVDSV